MISPYVIPGIEARTVTVTDVLQQVCKYRNHTAKIIKSKSRKREHVITRQLYCYLAREYTKSTFAEIGAAINRDRATVMYCIAESQNRYSLKPILDEFKKTFKL